jgi:hypothetical protein
LPRQCDQRHDLLTADDGRLGSSVAALPANTGTIAEFNCAGTISAEFTLFLQRFVDILTEASRQSAR